MTDFFQSQARYLAAVNRVIEATGAPFSDLVNEKATIIDVNDPDSMGRVRVLTSDDFTSDWIPMPGSGRGKLSAKFIGSSVLVTKIDGRSENMYVVGILPSSPEVGVTGTPVQLPVIDESLGVYSGSADQGMKCNRGNEGRLYVLSNEMNQDVVVCLRRTNPQTGSEPKWAWKSITNGLWVEKGINPGNEGDYVVAQEHRKNPGIPTCNESLLGEVHEFTEDRGFRTIQKRCQRDENKEFSWVPVGAIPTYFRSTLPTCSESIHGMQALLDDGNNSEVVVCQRYQGQMTWTRNGKRLPQKFYEKGILIKKEQFLNSFGSIEALEEEAESNSGYDWVSGNKDIVDLVIDEALRDVPKTGTDPRLRTILAATGQLPAQSFNRAATLSRVANAAVTKKTNIPLEEIFRTVRQELDRPGSITPETAKILEGVGEAGDILLNGVQTGTVEQALQQVGQSAIQSALTSLDPRTSSVMTGFMAGGVVGAIDAAAAIGLDKLPDEVNKYVGPIVDAAGDILKGYPVNLEDVVKSSVTGGLSNQLNNIITKAIGSNIIGEAGIQSLLDKLISGGLGDVSGLFASVAGLDSIVKLPAPYSGLPKLASSVLGLFGQENSLQDLFGKGGLGIESLQSFLGEGFPVALGVLGGLGGIAGLFGIGSGAGACPCGPKCRKTEHGQDSDGNNLLKSCRALTANNANAYSPTGTPIPNNTGPIASDQKLTNTLVGSPLIPPNPLNLTSSINTIARVGQMASKFYDSRFADEAEHLVELAYTFEATEKALKVADNNITRIESIERRLIDALFNLINDFICNKRKGGGLAVMTELIRDVRENSQAIKDLYAFVKKLDVVKKGGKAKVVVTPNISKSFQNIISLSRLSASSCTRATRALNGSVIPADKEWRTMEPGNNFSSVLGEYTEDIPEPFPNETTLFNGAKVLSESLSSRVGGNDPQASDQINSLLSRNQADALQRTPFSSVPRSVEEAVARQQGQSTLLSGGESTLSQLGGGILGQQTLPGLQQPLPPGESLYDAISDRKGQTNCE